MVAAAHVLLEEQDRRKAFAHAHFLLFQVRVDKVGGQRLRKSTRDVLGVLLANQARFTSTFAAYRSHIAEILAVSRWTVTAAFRQLRSIVLEGRPLLETPIVAGLHREAPWGREVHANLHGYVVAIDALLRDLEGRKRPAAAPAAAATRSPSTRPPPRRRHGPELAPLTVDEHAPEVAALAGQWDALGLQNGDGTPSRASVQERRTLAKRLREGWTAAELGDVIAGAGASPMLKARGNVRWPFAIAFSERRGFMSRFAHEGRGLAAPRPIDPGARDPMTSLDTAPTTLDLVSVDRRSISPKSPLPKEKAPSAQLERKGPAPTAPCSPLRHADANVTQSLRARVVPRPPPAGEPRKEREQSPSHATPRCAADVIALLDAGGNTSLLDRQGRVLVHPRKRDWAERMRRVCPRCGGATIGENLRCSACGAHKGYSS
jgi:hypothetical protein